MAAETMKPSKASAAADRVKGAMQSAYGKTKIGVSNYAGNMRIAFDAGFCDGYHGLEYIPKKFGATVSAAVGYRQGLRARAAEDKTHARLARAESRGKKR